jgi:hypothetical protein
MKHLKVKEKYSFIRVGNFESNWTYCMVPFAEKGISYSVKSWDSIISFHISGTPGRHQWLQSWLDGLSFQLPTCASLRGADIDVTWRTFIGNLTSFTTSKTVSENKFWSVALVSNVGNCVTLQVLRVSSLQQT